MTNYPYGRSGEPICHYQETTTKESLESSAEHGDNEVVFEDDMAYLYEAPAEDDPGRGHYSKWQKITDGEYKRVTSLSGDDGMCYGQFQEQTED